MARKFGVNITDQVFEALSGIAVQFGVDDVEQLVDAMLREKIKGLTNQDIPSIVSLTQQTVPSDSDLAQGLRRAVGSEMSTFETDLGPTVENAPEQSMSDLFVQQERKIAEQQAQIERLNQLVPGQGGAAPFGQRRG